MRAGVSRTSSRIVSIRAYLARPKLRLGFPSSSTDMLGDKALKNFFAVSSAFSTDELIDSAMARATAATKVASLSVGHRSTYADTKFLRGSLSRVARTSEVLP